LFDQTEEGDEERRVIIWIFIFEIGGFGIKKWWI
jgi:hypothetical protein